MTEKTTVGKKRNEQIKNTKWKMNQKIKAWILKNVAGKDGKRKGS